MTWSNSLEVIVLCIYEGKLRTVRKYAIKQFGKALADHTTWESAWKAIGGTIGLINLFAKISVAEVKALTSAIGLCSRGKHRVARREKAVEELLHALLPSHYPGSKLQTHDKRPIQDHYSRMVSACSLTFLEQLLDAKDKSNPLYTKVPIARLIKIHGMFLRKRVIEGTFGNGSEKDNLYQFLKAFAYSQPPLPGPEPKVSASMDFAMKLLKHCLKDTEYNNRWPRRVSIADLFVSLLRRLQKKKLPEARQHDVIMLGLQIVEARPRLKSEFEAGGIWLKLVIRWKRAPKLYENALVLALRVGLGGSQKTIGRDYLDASRYLQKTPELRWPLLRFYCLHVPKKGIDLDTDDDFKELSQQQWSTNVFYQLGKDQAIRLLKGLHNANQNHSFLTGPGGISILSIPSMLTQRNFNAVLLLTILQRDSQEAQMRAVGAVDELRKKAAASKEQSDRARLARAAADYSIASGSLDLYGETIVSQQRYVRDPFTVKEIYERGAVVTAEGIALLSGIPEPLPEDVTLAEIASRVEKANKILMTFHETMRMSKREPSFHKPDWVNVSALFGSAISARVTRAKDLQKRLKSAEADVYTSIWSGTLDMLQKVNVEFLIQATGPIRSLLDTLPPTALAATTKAMLEAGDLRRREEDRQDGDDILERLSYEVLLRLAKSDKPELAKQLVLRTILGRPDASSWHRQLLSVSFMKSLSAKDAQEMLLAFATEIGEKLEEQSYVQVGEAEPPKSAPPQSLVKVTTVKYLAQLLDNAQFISAGAAVEVLVELFKAGTHRDIRLATLDSLLSLLSSLCSGAEKNWRSNALVEKILEALETVIPVVGSVNERRPPRLEDWKEAEATGKLPEISEMSTGFSPGLPPLLNAIILAPSGEQYAGLKNLQAEFVTRFFLLILNHSQAEHQKWLILFLAKHEVEFTINDLPPTPISSQLWKILVEKYPRFIPQTVFDDFNKHLVMTIAPPVALKTFNSELRKNNDLRDTPEVQHWLHVYGQGVERYISSGTRTLVQMIHHVDRPQPVVRNGISFNKLLGMVTTHASLFLDDYEKFVDVWDDFVHDLRHPSRATQSIKDGDSIHSMVSAWQNSGRLLLEKLTALVIEKKRQRGEVNRGILPSANNLRIWLLPYPSLPKPAELDSECSIFAEELEELLETLLSGEANVLQWSKVAEDAKCISKMLNTDEERLRVASYIGKLTTTSDRAEYQLSSALNFVRVALAMRLIDDGRAGLKKSGKDPMSAQRKEHDQRLKTMIEEWQRASDDSIREKVRAWRRTEDKIWKDLMSSG